MGSMTIWHWLIVLALIILVFRTRRLVNLGDEAKQATRTPVYSAETTNGREAEFIRDQAPWRPPLAIIAAVAVLLCAAAWWVTR